MSIATFVVFVALHVGAARPTAAQDAPPMAAVYYEASSDQCPNEADFRAAVAARLGYDPHAIDAEREIRVRADESEALTITIETVGADDAEGQRQFHGLPGECEELMRSVVLAVSIAIDPSVLSRPPGTPPTLEPTPEPEPEPEPEPAPAPPIQPAEPSAPLLPPPPRRRGSDVGGAIHLGATGSLGASPQVVSVGARIGGELRHRRFAVGVALRGDLVGGGDVNGGRAAGHVFGAELSVCGRFEPAFVCGVGFFGAFRGEGEEFVDSSEVMLTHVSAGARAGVEIPIFEALAFRATFDLLANLTPAVLRVGREVVWEMPFVSAVLDLGLAVRLE